MRVDGIVGTFTRWLAQRRHARATVLADAERLAAEYGTQAFYEAQRRAARARCAGDADQFLHWARVAPEVARISPIAEMDHRVVTAIVDEEERRADRDSRRSIIK